MGKARCLEEARSAASAGPFTSDDAADMELGSIIIQPSVDAIHSVSADDIAQVASSCGILVTDGLGVVLARINDLGSSLDSNSAGIMIQDIIDNSPPDASSLIEGILCRCTDTAYVKAMCMGFKLLKG